MEDKIIKTLQKRIRFLNSELEFLCGLENLSQAEEENIHKICDRILDYQEKYKTITTKYYQPPHLMFLPK